MTGISDMSDEITENARVIENAQPAENIQSVKKAADNSGLYSGGVFRAGEKVQLTDRRLKKVTVQLVPGGLTSTEHGNIVHDDIIGKPEGTVTTTVSAKKKDSKTDSRKPWKNSTQTGGWQYSAMRPRLVDYVLSMPRGAQIMFPKDIAQVVSLADIRPGMKVLESGAGSGAMSLGILNAVGSRGKLVSIEIREDFAKIAMANAAVFSANGLNGGIFARAVSILLRKPWKNTVLTGLFLTCSILGTDWKKRMNCLFRARFLQRMSRRSRRFPGLRKP